MHHLIGVEMSLQWSSLWMLGIMKCLIYAMCKHIWNMFQLFSQKYSSGSRERVPMIYVDVELRTYYSQPAHAAPDFQLLNK
jgi:hypothetical protein